MNELSLKQQIESEPLIDSDQFPTPRTIDELKIKYGLKKSWFYSKTRLKGDAQLPHIRIGKYIRIFEHEFLAWLKKCQAERLSR